VQALPKTGSLIPHTSANLVKPKGALSKNIQKAPPKKGTGSALTTTVSGNAVISQAPSTRLNNAAAVNVMPGSGQILMQSQQMKMQDSVNRENTNSNTLANPNANFNSNTDSTVDQNGQTIIKKK
jgi:hypothetical protein